MPVPSSHTTGHPSLGIRPDRAVHRHIDTDTIPGCADVEAVVNGGGRTDTLHQTFTAFQREARAWVAARRQADGRLPDREAYRKQAIAILVALPVPAGR